MAEVVSEIPGANDHGNSRHQWDQWLDGQIWKLTPGVDFKSKPSSLRTLAYAVAQRRGGQVDTSLREGCLYIQFRKSPPPAAKESP